MTVSVENFSPPTSTEVEKHGPIAFDVLSDKRDGFTRLMIAVSYTVDGEEFAEIAHDGDNFRGDYLGVVNSRVPMLAGFRFTLLRDGGWPAAPTIEVYPAAIDLDNDQVTFVSVSGGKTDSGTTIIVSAPIGIQVGDLLVYDCQAQSGSGGPLLPAGYTLITNYSRSHFGGGTRHLSAWKFATAGDVAASSFSFFRVGTGTGGFIGILGVYRNAHQSAPIVHTLAGTDSGDPEIVCPGVGCHTAALSGSGAVSYWGPGFLTPFIPGYRGCMVVYTMGTGSGGSGGYIEITAPTTPSRATTGTWIMAYEDTAESVIRVRRCGQGYYSVPFDEEFLEVPKWTGGSLPGDQGLGSTIILRPPE